MEGEWPLVGRAAELERVGRLLRDGAGGIVLAGPAGVGKTRLAGECLALAEQRGFVPLRVTATQAASTLPFGPFAPLMPELTGTDRLELLRQVASAIRARGDGKAIALLVDDAHLLDEGSAALTHQLAAGKDMFLVGTVRATEAAPDAVMTLWKDGLVERVEVAELSLSDVECLLASVLGGPVDAPAARLFFDRTEGNALFLKELIVGALEAGSLNTKRGLWGLSGELPTSARLVELVQARLAGLAEPERNAIEVLAVGEPLGEEVVGHVELRSLERRGLVRVDEDGRRLQVSLGHPLYGDVLRGRLSPLRARAVSRTLADALEARGARRREDILRLATWRLDGGGNTQPEVMLIAARRARRRWALPLAERFARAAAEAGAGFEAGLLIGQLAWLQGRHIEAEQLLASLEPLNDFERARLADVRISNLCHGLGRVDEAVAVGEDTEAAITDVAARDEVVAKRASVLLIAGHTRAVLQLLEPMLARATGRASINAMVYAAIASIFPGRFVDALRWCDEGRARQEALTGVPVPVGSYTYPAVKGAALTFSGSLFAAEELLDSEYQRGVADGSVEAQGIVGGVLARALLARGRLTRAAHVGREAAIRYREIHLPALVRFSLAPVAHALALAGRADEADAVLAELDVLPPAIRWWQTEVDQARAWTAVHRGDMAKANGILRESAATANASGDCAYESAVLHDLARLGGAKDVWERLNDLALSIGGDFATARAAHAIALATADPNNLEHASGTFEAIGADLLAAEAAADAAVAWRKAGNPRKAAGAEQRAHALAARCEGARTPALTAVIVRAALTTRELEIARLAAAGVPNKEIAARLYLSLHTVQNKLHSAYEKLGVEGRSGLADALKGY
jgi:DNA-binding CsgD family transcriptional regulator